MKEIGLEAGLAVEHDDVVVAELLEGELLRDQADFGRSDRDEDRNTTIATSATIRMMMRVMESVTRFVLHHGRE